MTRVLFSPVGSADPITGLGDGPMLHIVRHYRPDAVVLLLSPAMVSYEQQDQRYSRAIQLVSAALKDGTSEYVPTLRIIASSTDQVHRYDIHIQQFDSCLRELSAEFPGSGLLLNISSGTPGMQHALVAIDAFGTLPTTAIQVPTPRNAMNRRGDREDPAGYDLDLLWELNPDNDANAANRCIEVASPHFGALLQRENIKRLVQAYDYAAAARLAVDAGLSSEATKLIKGAASRVALDHAAAASNFRGTTFAYDPADRLREYVQTLEVLIARNQWAEFTVRCTPAITETMYAALRPYLPDSAYIKTEKGDRKTEKGGRRLDRDKVERNADLSKILRLRPGTGDPFVTNKNLFDLIGTYCTDPSTTEQMRALRRFEEGVRNYVAHEVGRVDKAIIARRGECQPEAVLRILLKRAGAKPGLYQAINDEILDQIDGAAVHQ